MMSAPPRAPRPLPRTSPMISGRGLGVGDLVQVAAHPRLGGGRYTTPSLAADCSGSSGALRGLGDDAWRTAFLLLSSTVSCRAPSLLPAIARDGDSSRIAPVAERQLVRADGRRHPAAEHRVDRDGGRFSAATPWARSPDTHRADGGSGGRQQRTTWRLGHSR